MGFIYKITNIKLDVGGFGKLFFIYWSIILIYIYFIFFLGITAFKYCNWNWSLWEQEGTHDYPAKYPNQTRTGL